MKPIIERLKELLELVTESKKTEGFGSKLGEMDYIEELIYKTEHNEKLNADEMKACNKLWKKY